MLKTLAIIPARGGSKGVKNKNIRMVAGEPLINYSIKCAMDSNKITRTIVSTDYEPIKKIARQQKCEILNRPKRLANDDTPIFPVIEHAIKRLLTKHNEKYDLIVLLQPTSPIRTGRQIDDVVKMFEHDNDLEEVISVVPMDDTHPARMYKLDEDNLMIPFDFKLEKTRRQKLPLVYYRNGCIYAIRTKSLLDKKSLINENKKAYVMPLSWLANIDDERDLIIADALVKEWKEGRL